MIEQDIDLMERGELETESLHTLRALQPWEDMRYTRSDLGNAQLFADFFGDRARYMDQQECWYVYNGRFWQPDRSELQVHALAKHLTALLNWYVGTVTDMEKQTLFVKQLQRWQSLKGRIAIINDARAIYPLTPDMMDADPMQLNCQNGTLDLETGALHPHQAADLLTRICAAEYHPRAKSERWERFVYEIMQPAASQPTLQTEEEAALKAQWLQRMLGYALTGDTRLECLFMLYGATTRNGKGTLTETFLRLMGTYATAMRPESLGVQLTRSGAGPSEDIARLQGVRYVSVAEPDQRLHLSASLVKTLTGNDTITARYLHQNSFEYKPQFKLFINTNHLPRVDDLTLFDSGRVMLVPFERHFDAEHQDRTLKHRFTRPYELSGILNWCMDGLRQLRENNFLLGDMPRTAQRSLTAYRTDSDPVGRFVRECLVTKAQSAQRMTDVYAAYSLWCNQNGEVRLPSVHFRRQLEKHYRLGRGRLNGSTTCSLVFDCELNCSAADAADAATVLHNSSQ